MTNWRELIDKFVFQSQIGDLKTSTYPKEESGLKIRVSFGMGAPARVPWIALIADDVQVSRGIYPVYLYYKDLETLILAYGISETEEYGKSWPAEIMNSSQTVEAYFDKNVPRYGKSFVFKSYKVKINNNKVEYFYDSGNIVSDKDIEVDLSTITDYYKKIINPGSINNIVPPIADGWNAGLFYMEKQLEDFLILNWENTGLGKKYDLIIEEGVLISQQYKTDIGPIDILVKEKNTGTFVVIELKRNQTSDDTVGQLARYMGWIMENKKTEIVKGIIIAGSYDKKLDYALKMIKNVEVFIYEVDFKLKEFKTN